MTAPIRDLVGMPGKVRPEILGTLSVADDQCLIPMPKCRVVRAVGGVHVRGTVSGTCSLEIENVGLAGAGTQSIGVLALAYDGADNQGEEFTLEAGEDDLLFADGELLAFNVDAVAGGADSADGWAEVEFIYL